MHDRQGKPLSQAMREWTQFSLLLFASAWGIYTFVFKETIVPARRPATLAVSSAIDEIGRRGQLALVRVRIHAVNHTDRPIYAPALWYTVWGVRLVYRDLSDSQFASSVDSNLGERQDRARYAQAAVRQVIATGTILNGTERLPYQPTDETNNEIVFYAPADRFDAVELKVQFLVAKSIDEIASTKWSVTPGGELAGDPVLKGRRFKEDSTDVELYDPENPRHRTWLQRAGAGYNWSVSSFSLWKSGSR